MADRSLLQQAARPRLELRRCACGCPRDFLVRPTSNRKFWDVKCRVRDNRRKVRAAAAEAGLPSALTLATVREVSTGGSTTSRKRNAQTGRPPRRRRPSDVRVTYRRVLDVMVAELGDERGRAAALRTLTTKQRMEVEADEHLGPEAGR